MKFTRYFLSIFFLTGCSSIGVDRDVQNTIVHEFYAEVSLRNEVELSSNVKTGIVGGSIIGALELSDGDSEDIIGGAIIGAILGGLFTSLSEGGNQAFEYHCTYW